jgi:hypothetical protein
MKENFWIVSDGMCKDSASWGGEGCIDEDPRTKNEPSEQSKPEGIR